MQSGVSKKEYLKLVKKFKVAQINGENFLGMDFAKILAYSNNKPYKEIFAQMMEDVRTGELPLADIDCKGSV